MPVPFLFASASGAVPASELDSDFADLEAKIQTSSTVVGTAAGTANAITAAFTPTVTALSAGLTFLVRAASANTSTTPTFQADGTTAKTIVKGANKALVAGDIMGAGHWLELTYDATLDKYVLANPALTVNSLMYLGSSTASAVATLDSPAIPAGFKSLQLVLRNIFPATSTSDILLRVSQGGSFKSDANYFWSSDRVSTAAAQNLAGTATDTSIHLDISAGNGANSGLTGTVFIAQGGVGNYCEISMPNAFYFTSSSVWNKISCGGVYAGAFAQADQIRLLASAGNITGTIDLYGLP